MSVVALYVLIEVEDHTDAPLASVLHAIHDRRGILQVGTRSFDCSVKVDALPVEFYSPDGEG